MRAAAASVFITKQIAPNYQPGAGTRRSPRKRKCGLRSSARVRCSARRRSKCLSHGKWHMTHRNHIPHFRHFVSVTRRRCDVLERRADDHDKSIARSKELGMELQDAFAYVQKFSTSSQAPLPPPHETPSGQSAASLVLVLKE